MDHSGSLPVIAKLAKNAKIIASERGKDALIEHFGPSSAGLRRLRPATSLSLGRGLCGLLRPR